MELGYTHCLLSIVADPIFDFIHPPQHLHDMGLSEVSFHDSDADDEADKPPVTGLGAVASIAAMLQPVCHKK